MKLSEMFPRKYVAGRDLQGRTVTVTIQSVKPERMRPSPQTEETTKYVLYTVEGKKRIVLGKVLAQQIARALGSDETDDWQGQRITLYPEPVTVGGAPRIAIQARAVNGQA